MISWFVVGLVLDDYVWWMVWLTESHSQEHLMHHFIQSKN